MWRGAGALCLSEVEWLVHQHPTAAQAHPYEDKHKAPTSSPLIPLSPCPYRTRTPFTPPFVCHISSGRGGHLMHHYPHSGGKNQHVRSHPLLQIHRHRFIGCFCLLLVEDG